MLLIVRQRALQNPNLSGSRNPRLRARCRATSQTPGPGLDPKNHPLKLLESKLVYRIPQITHSQAAPFIACLACLKRARTWNTRGGEVPGMWRRPAQTRPGRRGFLNPRSDVRRIVEHVPHEGAPGHRADAEDTYLAALRAPVEAAHAGHQQPVLLVVTLLGVGQAPSSSVAVSFAGHAHVRLVEAHVLLHDIRCLLDELLAHLLLGEYLIGRPALALLLLHLLAVAGDELLEGLSHDAGHA
eukprot:9489847-Pyramimonas_sp.AAC.2